MRCICGHPREAHILGGDGCCCRRACECKQYEEAEHADDTQQLIAQVGKELAELSLYVKTHLPARQTLQSDDVEHRICALAITVNALAERLDAIEQESKSDRDTLRMLREMSAVFGMAGSPLLSSRVRQETKE
jgi:hypothetical protein